MESTKLIENILNLNQNIYMRKKYIIQRKKLTQKGNNQIKKKVIFTFK